MGNCAHQICYVWQYCDECYSYKKDVYAAFFHGTHPCCGRCNGNIWSTSELLIGQTAGFTGIVAPAVNGTLSGAMLYIDQVNGKGVFSAKKLKES